MWKPMILVLSSITDASKVIFSEGLEIIEFSCLWSPWGQSEDIANFGWGYKSMVSMKGRDSLIIAEACPEHKYESSSWDWRHS